MIVKLRAGDPRYPDLTPDHPYVVLGIEADDFRILNDVGRPYLYPHELFEVVDSREPEDWVSELGEDNERLRSRQAQYKNTLPLQWVAGAVGACLVGGFLLGLWWTDHRSRKRHGGIRIY